MRNYKSIIRYFCTKAWDKMEPIYGSEKSDILIDRLETKMAQLYTKNSDFFPNDLAKKHGVNPIFLIALKSTLRREIEEFHDFEQFVMDIIFKIYEPKMNFYKSLAKDTSNRWEKFIEDKKKIVESIYNNPLFNLEYTHEDRFRFGFNLKRCFNFELLEKNGYPELTQILCQFEYVLAENLKSWVKISQQQTICGGDPICAFRYLNIDPQ